MSLTSEKILPESQPESEGLVQKLLAAMAAEWLMLATKIEKLGDFFSADALSRGSLTAVGQLQEFDAITQMANSQSKILRDLSIHLGQDGAVDPLTLATLIEKVPLEIVRNQLYAAVFGHQRETTAALPEDELADWFED